MVTAEDGTTTQSYTVNRSSGPARSRFHDSTDDTITSLLSRLDAGLVPRHREHRRLSFHNQTVGYVSNSASEDAIAQGSLSPAGFNYPAGFGPWYTVEALAVNQGGAPDNIEFGRPFHNMCAVPVTSVAEFGHVIRSMCLPAGVPTSTFHLEGNDWDAILFPE